VAEKMIVDGALSRQVEERYAGWDSQRGRAILDGRHSLDELARDVERRELDPRPRSGHQERLEHLVTSYL
jgi:xylose isomerase